MVRLSISAKKLSLVLTVVVVGLVVCHVITQLIFLTGGYTHRVGLARQFDLNGENNIPSWYSSLTLLISAALLGVIGLHKRQIGEPFVRHWLALAAIFVYLSVDEAASIHEMTSKVLMPFLEPTGYFHGYLFYSWVVFGAILVLIVAAVYLRFLSALPAKTRGLFLLAGILYVGGAIGVETAGARQDYLYGQETITYALLVACEEGLEMSAIVIFIYALCSYASSLQTGLQILISNGRVTNLHE